MYSNNYMNRYVYEKHGSIPAAWETHITTTPACRRCKFHAGDACSMYVGIVHCWLYTCSYTQSCSYVCILILDDHTRMGQHYVPYAYEIPHTRTGRPIRVWADICIWGKTYSPEIVCLSQLLSILSLLMESPLTATYNCGF